MNNDYCKIWYSKTPYDVNGSSTPVSGVQITSGRTRVHAFWMMNRYINASTEIGLTRPVSLLDSSGGNVLYKCAFINPTGGASVNPSQHPLSSYSNYFGGNGILFEDGVWFGVDGEDQSGSIAADSKTAMYAAVIYSGGVNT